MKLLSIKSLALSIIALSSTYCSAQTTSTQTFNVLVPISLSITAPTAAVGLTHNETDEKQTFPPQSWTVKGNALNGVNVTFVAAPFANASDGSVKRDTELSLGLGAQAGPATWTIEKASDVTSYAGANPNPLAQVSARSNASGRASLNLTVKFVTEEYGIFPAGNYLTTVTGTIAAN